jgi:hypothetical protein
MQEEAISMPAFAAERPDYFKTAKQVSGGGKVRIRKDSSWNVPNRS